MNRQPWMNQPGPKQPQPEPIQDPQYRVTCECGGQDFEINTQMWRRPSQIVGNYDVTVVQQTLCKACGALIDPIKTKVQKEYANAVGGGN